MNDAPPVAPTQPGTAQAPVAVASADTPEPQAKPAAAAAPGSTPAPAPRVTSRQQSEDQAAAEAQKTGFPYADTRDISEVEDLEGKIDLDTLRKYRVAPLHLFNDHSIELGLTANTDHALLPELQQSLPHTQLTFKTISVFGYNYIINHLYYRSFAPERGGKFEVLGDKLKTAPPKQAFQLIAQLAYWLGASDIHIEPQAEEARIRFRLDGVLHPITTVATNSYRIFLSDLQTRAEIKWGSDDPQSGRITYNLMNNDARIVSVNMRIETIPTFHGEEIVVRIFNNEHRNLNLETLGFSDTQIQRLERVAEHPNGMVLTVGPTGSGKTSTLYALINRLNTPEVKIVTLEDPIEYDLPGISQIAVKTEDKDSFIQKLRAVMREDPNVVMIGEIRDMDTAKTALQAALTGHLVLSTFHATNASAAITRMLDLVTRNPLFPSAIRMIIAQRLARRVCPHCIEEVAPTEEQMAFIESELEKIPENRRPHLPKNLKLRHGKGCPKCHGLGYRGRVAIIEMMPITPDIEKMMVSTTAITAQEIEDKAVRNGMATLGEDALLKALEGATTVEEIMSLTVA